MKKTTIKMIICALLVGLIGPAPLAGPIAGQQSSGSSTQGSQSPQSSGSSSIEAEMFAYKSLQSDSEAIACDIAGYFQNGKASFQPQDQAFNRACKVCNTIGAHPKDFDPNQIGNRKGVIIVSSIGTTAANFMVWRANLMVMKRLIAEARSLTKSLPVLADEEHYRKDLKGCMDCVAEERKTGKDCKAKELKTGRANIEPQQEIAFSKDVLAIGEILARIGKDLQTESGQRRFKQDIDEGKGKVENYEKALPPGADDALKIFYITVDNHLNIIAEHPNDQANVIALEGDETAGHRLAATLAANATSQSTSQSGSPVSTDPLSITGQVMPLIQSSLAMFASNSSVVGVPGTIQDQALTDGVARQLRALGVKVVTPDIYAPLTISKATPDDSPFLHELTDMLSELLKLQQALQVNQAILTMDARRLSLSITIEGDRSKFDQATKAIEAAKVDAEKKTAEAARQSVSEDMAKAQAELCMLSARLGAKQNDLIKDAQENVTKVQALIAAMQGFLANLTGGAVSFGPSPSPMPAVTSAPTATTPSPTGQAATPAPTPSQTPAPATTATPQAAQQPPGGVAPIIAVLSADGLARKLGVKENDLDPDALDPAKGGWRLLSIKALESGGSLITHSNVLGSKTYFSGGAVATYGLFRLDGTLDCSGNVFAYAGYVRAEKVRKQLAKYSCS